MNERRPPNPYRPDPPIFPPVVFDEEEPNPGRRRVIEVDPDEREVRRDFETPRLDDAPGRASWDWDGNDFDDDRGGRGRGRRGGGGGGGGGGRRGGSGGRGSGGYASDRGLVGIVAIVGVLALVVIALVLPWSPVRLIGRASTTAGADGITATPRGSIPTLPNGFVALSKLYDVKVPESAKGPWSIEVTLNEQTKDANNIAFYAYDGTRWTRVANVTLAQSGTSVAGDINSPPGSLAVLRRTGQAKTLALIVPAGERLDSTAIDATSIVAVMAASVGADGTLQATAGAVKSIGPTAGKAKLYFGVTAAGDGQGAVKNLGSATSISAHAEALATAAKSEGAGGVYVDYPNVPSGQKDAFTTFVKALRERLQKDQLGLVVGVPANAGASGAYDWGALAGASDGVWVRGPADPATYYDQMEQLLTAKRSDKTDLAKVSLVIDRRSIDRQGQQSTSISLRDALTAASTIDRSAATAPAALGGTVALKAMNLGAQGGGLHWDAGARMVAFAYSGGNVVHNVWIENRYSAAFRMDLASRYNLGGVVVDQAKQDDALPAIWDVAVLFAQDGSVKLERPYGPYLAACWQTAQGQGSVEGVSNCWGADNAPVAVNWRAPQQQGLYNVRLTVSDGVTFVAQEVVLSVGTGSTPTPTPTATATASGTPRPSATATPTPTATARPGTPTPTPTAAATSTPPPTATPPPIVTSTPIPTPPAGVPPGPAGQ